MPPMRRGQRLRGSSFGSLSAAHIPGFLSPVAVAFMRIILALVLTAASVSKLFAFRSFAGSLPRLASVPEWLAPSAAACVMLVECVTGLLLFVRRSARPAAVLSLFLFLSFTVVLTDAIVRGVDAPCSCFGALGLILPLRAQAALDLLLASGALFLIRHSGGWRRRIEGHVPLSRAAALVFLSWGSALIIWPHPEASGQHAITGPPGGEIFSGTPGRLSVLLLADFEDFGCQLCLDDFLAFCDSLNTGPFRSTIGVRLIARRDPARNARDQARLLAGWASGNGYGFPVSVDADSLFERSGVGKTSAILVAADGRLLDIVHFPTGSLRRNQILHLFQD